MSDLDSLTVIELKKLLREQGLAVSGNKSVCNSFQSINWKVTLHLQVLMSDEGECANHR